MTNSNQSETVLVKNLYQAVTGDRSWDARWSEYKDPGEENTKLQPYRSLFPIIHKWTCQSTADEENEEEIWITKAVEINDERLRALIETLLADVPNLNLEGAIMKFDSPFKPFLFKWQEFKEALETETDEQLKILLQHLHDIISPSVDSILHKVKRAKVTQSIDWNTLLECCVPGELILGTLNNRKQAYKISSSGVNWDELGRRYQFLDADFHDWDGTRSGCRSSRFKITEFKGEKSLKSLNLTPFKFLQNSEDVKSELIERGKLFESLIGHSFRHYSGLKIMPDRSSQVGSSP